MEIIKKDDFLVVGLKVKAFEHELFVKMPKAYDKFKLLMHTINYRVNNYIMDICLHKRKNIYTQLICVEVTHLTPLKEVLVGMKIPKGNYLYHVYQGEVQGIYQAFVEMYDYALENKIQLDKDEFKIEIHDEINKMYHLYIRLV